MQSIPRLGEPKNRRFSHKNPKMFDFSFNTPNCIETMGGHQRGSESENFFLKNDFRFNTPISSLKQDQGSAFTARECAQSNPRLEKPKNRRFSHKNPKMLYFRFNTLTPFPESGSRKHFHASGMRGIDFSHKITPRNMFFQQKNFSPRISGKSHPPPLRKMVSFL